MPYYDKEQVEKAREMDLLTYLRLCDPGDLVKVSGENYSTRTHDSMSISNGKWMWWSRGFGGASALDYLVKVRGHPFTEAVGMILNAEGGRDMTKALEGVLGSDYRVRDVPPKYGKDMNDELMHTHRMLNYKAERNDNYER